MPEIHLESNIVLLNYGFGIRIKNRSRHPDILVETLAMDVGSITR